MNTDQTRDPALVPGRVPRPPLGQPGPDDDTGRIPAVEPGPWPGNRQQLDDRGTDGHPAPVEASDPAADGASTPETSGSADGDASPAMQVQGPSTQSEDLPDGEPASSTAATSVVGRPGEGGRVRAARRTLRLPGLRRHSSRLWLVVAAALAGMAVALAGNLVLGPSYTSETGVLWDPSSAQLVDETVTVDPNLLDRQVTDQQDVIASDAVIGAVSDDLGVDVDDVRDAISTTVADGSSLITISAKSDTADSAMQIAAAVTNAYVQYLATSGADSLTARADALQTTIDRQNAQLTTLTAQLNDQTNQLETVDTASSTYAVLQGQVTQLSGQVSDLTGRIADVVDQQESLRAAAEIYPGAARVLQQAELPTAPSSFSLPVTVVLGAGLGILVAGCVIGLQVARNPAAGGRRDDDTDARG